MSRSSAAVKLQFHKGWKDLIVGRAPHRPSLQCPRRSARPLGPAGVFRLHGHTGVAHLAASQLKQTFHFTHTQIGWLGFLLLSAAVSQGQSLGCALSAGIK